MDLGSLQLYLFYFIPSTLILPISVGVFTWNTLVKNLRLFTIGLTIYFVISLVAIFPFFFHIQDTQILNYLISAIDCIITTYVITFAFKEQSISKRFRLVSIFIFTFTVFDYFYLSKIISSLNYSSLIKSVFLIFLILYYFKKLIKVSNSKSLLQIPLFIIVMTNLIAICFGSFVDMVSPYLMENRLIDALLIISCFGFVIQGFCNLIYTIGIWKGSYDSPYKNLKV